MGHTCSKSDPCKISETLTPVKTVYVDAECGSDRNNGKCKKYAFKTLDRAIRKTRCYKSVKFVIAEGNYPVTKSFDSSNYWFEGSLQKFGDVRIERVENELGMNIYLIIDEIPPNVSIELPAEDSQSSKSSTRCLRTSNIRSDKTFAWRGELDVTKKYKLYQHTTVINVQANSTNNSLFFSNCIAEYDNVQVANNIIASENAVLVHNNAIFMNGEVYANRSLIYASEFKYQGVKLVFDTFGVEGTLELHDGCYRSVYGLAREILAKNSDVILEKHITEGNDQFTNCKVTTKDIKFAFATYTCCNNNCHEEAFLGAGLLGSSSGCGFGSCSTSCRFGRCTKPSKSTSNTDTSVTPAIKTVSNINTAKCRDDPFGDSTAIQSSVTKYACDSSGNCRVIDGPTESCVIDDTLTKNDKTCCNNLKQDELIRYTLISKSSTHYLAANAKINLQSDCGKLMFNDHSILHHEFNSQSNWQLKEGIYPIDMIGGKMTGSTEISVTGNQIVPRYFKLESGSLIILDVASYVGLPNGNKAINYLEDNTFFPIPAVKTTIQSTLPTTQTYQRTVNTVSTTEPSLIPNNNI